MRWPTSFGRLLACIGVICLPLCLGCASARLVLPTSLGVPRAPGADVQTSQSASGELPPKEAARVCVVAAEQLQSSGHLEQAIALYEKARSNDPGLKSVSHRLAVLYDAQGDSARSLAEYYKAIEADPKNPNILSDLGYYHIERGNYVEAERWLREALSMDPSHQKALCNLGFLLAAQGRFDESFAVYAKALGPAAAHSNVGVVMAKQGRYDQAKAAFRQALAADPALPQARAFLAYLDRLPAR